MFDPVEIRLLLQVGDDDHMLDGRQIALHGSHALERIEVAAVVTIAVSSEEDFRFDLTEPVENPLRPEIGRA